jgi:heavy metal translocating P-type ATPase
LLSQKIKFGEPVFKKTLTRARQYYLFIIAILVVIAGLYLQFAKYHMALHWLLGIAATLELIPLIWSMWQKLRIGAFGIDILAAAAIVSSVIMRQYWAAITIAVVLTGSIVLEDYAMNKAQMELKNLLNKAPKEVHLIKGRKETEVAISVVRAGATLIIKSGEVVPVDSIIIENESSFDESSLTGESVPQYKKVGDKLLSGSIVLDGAVTVKALRSAADSQYEQIVRLVRGAANSQSPFVRLADKYSVAFTVFAFMIAIAAWAISHHGIRFLDVIVVATPYPLIMAAPISTISGMNRAAKHGIIVKNSRVLESTAEARTVAFDKTGTLTESELTLNEIKTFNGYKKDQILALAAALEKGSSHILARVVLKASAVKKLKLAKAKNVREEAGLGLDANVNGRQILIGSVALLEKHGVKLPKTFGKSLGNHTVILVSVNHELAGFITFENTLRKDSKRAIARLRKLHGIKNIIMITGDNWRIARDIGRRLGITNKEIMAETLPADKLSLLESIKDEYQPTIFVGDGVNDAPVLTAADVGIALGARGEPMASESADVIIMINDISRVASILAIAKRTFSIARQSIIIGIAVSLILVLVFSAGHIRPIYGVISQGVIDVFVIFYALRAHIDTKSDLKLGA